MRVPASLRGGLRAAGSPGLDGGSHWRVTGPGPEAVYGALMDPDRVAALDSPLPATPGETEASLQLMR